MRGDVAEVEECVDSRRGGPQMEANQKCGLCHYYFTNLTITIASPEDQ